MKIFDECTVFKCIIIIIILYCVACTYCILATEKKMERNKDAFNLAIIEHPEKSFIGNKLILHLRGTDNIVVLAPESILQYERRIQRVPFDAKTYIRTTYGEICGIEETPYQVATLLEYYEKNKRITK